MEEKKYTEDGFLIVSESYKCPYWEKDTKPCTNGWNQDCYFCKYANFRTLEYIHDTEVITGNKELSSVCNNEKNKKQYNKRSDNNEN